MWPVNSTKCIEKVKKYQAPEVHSNNQYFIDLVRDENETRDDLSLSNLSNLSLSRIKSQTFEDVSKGLSEWVTKIQDNTQWSDPIRPDEFQQFIENTKEVAANSVLTQYELNVHIKRRAIELIQKAKSRKRVKTGLPDEGFTLEEGFRRIEEKKQKETEELKKKEYNNFMRLWRLERDEIHIQDVTARKAEKARVKHVKELTKQNAFISIKWATPIMDPEAEWKTSNVIWKEEEAKKKNAKMGKDEGVQHFDDEDEDEDEDLFILNTTDNDSLRRQENYIPFYENEMEDDDDDISTDEEDIVI